MKTVIVTLASVMSMAAQADQVQVRLQRCEQVKQFSTRSLNPKEANLFKKWTAVCRPDLAMEVDRDGFMEIDGGTFHMYPIFGQVKYVPDDTGTSYSGKKPVFADPLNYVPPFGEILSKTWDTVHEAPCNIPEDYMIIGWCRSSCYTPDQKVAFLEGDIPILEAMNKDLGTLVSLSPEATLESVKGGTEPYWHTDLLAYVVSPEDKEHDVIDFKTSTGGTLTVTTNHPMLNGQGVMKEAGLFKEGDTFLHEDGVADVIVSAKHRKYYGKVYNVETNTFNEMQNILVAQGYLTGSSLYMNEYANKMNRQILRNSLITAEMLK